MIDPNGDTIVVIDDDNDVLDVLGGLLDICGYPVKTYPSAEDFFADKTVQPSCLVLDQNMPDMSGLDLIAKLRSERHPIPTVLITGLLDPETASRAEALGVTKVLTKPMSHHELLDGIEICLH